MRCNLCKRTFPRKQLNIVREGIKTHGYCSDHAFMTWSKLDEFKDTSYYKEALDWCTHYSVWKEFRRHHSVDVYHWSVDDMFEGMYVSGLHDEKDVDELVNMFKEYAMNGEEDDPKRKYVPMLDEPDYEFAWIPQSLWNEYGKGGEPWAVLSDKKWMKKAKKALMENDPWTKKLSLKHVCHQCKGVTENYKLVCMCERCYAKK